MVDLSALSVEDTMAASVGGLWELAPVVVRWIIQLGTVQGRTRAKGRARVVIPGVATIVVSGAFP